MNDWKSRALELHKKGKSWRSIARKLGKSKSTVSDYLRKQTKGYVRPQELKEESAPDSSIVKNTKVLFLDIETKPLIKGGWGMFNQNYSLEQIEEDWAIISFSCKWMDCEDVEYYDITQNTEVDLLYLLHDRLSQADFVVGHSLKRFDLKKIRARMIINGFPPYNKPREIDTLEIAKREFGFTSNKLAYLTQTLCKKYVKSSHEKFHGYLLWKEFLKGNPEAIQEMREYNILDVLSLQELFEVLAPWDSRLPNFDLYTEEVLDNKEWEEDGYHYTNLGKYKKYRNVLTGQYRRGRVNLLSKEKRASLLANIV